MPTYEYRCAKCGDFEAFHGMKDPSLAACPTCRGPVTRLISKGGGLIFKGSGFYITDYRSADYKEKAAGESGGGKPASAPDAKPAGETGTASGSAPASTGGAGTAPASGGGSTTPPPPSTSGPAST